MKPICLTIAGTDTVGGAGVSLDLQVFKTLNKRGVFVISVVVAQNSSRVFSHFPLPDNVFSDQLAAMIESNPPTAIKVGLISGSHIDHVRSFCSDKGLRCPIVCDPVLASSSGYNFSSPDSLLSFFPYCALITPNVPEAEILSQKRIDTKENLYLAGKVLLEKSKGVPVLIKGGHFREGSSDYLFTKDEILEIETRHVDCVYKVRGTGCLFSSAITSFLAEGFTLVESITSAKRFLEKQIQYIEVEDQENKIAVFDVR